jgi:signal transduction histidine kinase
VRFRVARAGVFFLLLSIELFNAARTCAAQTSKTRHAEQTRVLILYSTRRDGAEGRMMEPEFQRLLGAGLGGRLDYYAEFLDLARFQAPAPQASLREYLARKYAYLEIDLVIAVTEACYEFVADHRTSLFPGAAIVFSASRELRRDANTTGIISPLNFAGTLALIPTLQSEIKRVFVISGASEYDRFYESLARSQFAQLNSPLALTYLSGLSMTSLVEQASRMPPDSAIYFLSVTQDSDGSRMLTVDAVDRITATASVPSYGWHTAMLGHGVVGGEMGSMELLTRQISHLALRVLNGEPADAIPVATIDSTVLAFDRRELRRWRISDSRIPPGSDVRFGEPTLWERSKPFAPLIVTSAIAIAFLGTTLLVEHRRRRHAEMVTRRHLATMAHMDRLAGLGQLTASLAHELHQPLGAILRNSEAANLLLSSGQFSTEELREIVDDIRRDDKRASEIIRRMKGLLSKRELNHEIIDVNDVVRETIALVGPAAKNKGVQLDATLPAPAVVSADRVHIQQVLLNILLNGLDALAGMPGDRRRLTVLTAADNGVVDVAVRDSGPGISEASMAEIFEPFVSTKSNGMGMGLAIARSIVEAHHGRIVASNNPDRGATIRFSLPTSRGR